MKRFIAVLLALAVFCTLMATAFSFCVTAVAVTDPIDLPDMDIGDDEGEGNDPFYGEEDEINSEGVLRGDVDGSGEFDDDDAIHLLFHYFFPDDSAYALNQDGDFDGSGELDDDDAIYLLFHYFFPDDPNYKLKNNFN